MKKFLASLAAASVLVAGVATASVITGSSASAQESTDEGDAPAVERPERGAVIREVLEQLVADGEVSLTDAEIDTIIAALEEKREELKANRPLHRHHRGFRDGARFGFHVGTLLEDGVIDSEELAELPEGHPLTDPDGPFGDVNGDEEITEEEFRGVIEELREQMQDRFGGARFGGPRFGGPRSGPPADDEAPGVEGTSV